MVKPRHPGSSDYGETIQLSAQGQPVLPLSQRWPDQSGGFRQSLPPCSSRLGESETSQAGLVKILSCKLILLAPISPRWGSLRTEAPGDPRLAKWPCEYTVTAGRALPEAGWTGVVGVLTMGARDPAQLQSRRPETGSRRPGRREAGGRDRQTGLPSPVCGMDDCLMSGPGDQARRRRTQGFPGQRFGCSKSKAWCDTVA